jgi:hypothetical protein
VCVRRARRAWYPPFENGPLATQAARSPELAPGHPLHTHSLAIGLGLGDGTSGSAQLLTRREKRERDSRVRKKDGGVCRRTTLVRMKSCVARGGCAHVPGPAPPRPTACSHGVHPRRAATACTCGGGARLSGEAPRPRIPRPRIPRPRIPRPRIPRTRVRGAGPRGPSVAPVVLPPPLARVGARAAAPTVAPAIPGSGWGWGWGWG